MNMTPVRGSRIPGPNNVRGVGLIEVLVAVAILAFGLLGIAALQATALRNSQSSYQRSQAVTQTYSIMDRMRANLTVVHAGGYNTTLMCQESDVPADGGAMAQNDLTEWLAGMQDPQILDKSACGKIECVFDATTTTHECKVTVQWDDSRGTHTSDDGTEGGTKETISTSTAI